MSEFVGTSLSRHGVPFSCTCLVRRWLPSDGLMNHVANRIGNKLFLSANFQMASACVN